MTGWEAKRPLRGYGPRGPRVVWPNQARVVVNLVLNYEEGAEYSLERGHRRQEGFTEYNQEPLPWPHRDLAAESVYEYGSRRGIWRLADLIDRFGVKVTVNAVAMALALNPDVARWTRDQGHDVMAHGLYWTEPWWSRRREEADDIHSAVKIITECVGTRPLGWNSRYGPSRFTRELLVEEGGFLYDSDAYNDDLPYFVEVSGRRHLVIPYTKLYNDTRFIMAQGFSRPDDFFDTCQAALDYLRDEGATHPKMMSIGIHARIMGQAARAAALKKFLTYATRQDGVLFMRRSDIAQWWMAHYSTQIDGDLP